MVAAVTPRYRPAEVPRLTSALRSEKGSFIDVDEQYLLRKAELEKLRLNKDAAERRNGVGSSALARSLIPSWSAAPLEVRETYEKFLQAAGQLVGGELSSEELHQVAESVYGALRDVGDGRSSSMSKSLLAQKKQELAALWGPITSDAALQKAADLAVNLQQFTRNSDASVASGNSGKPFLASESREFGIEFDFHPPTLFDAGQEREGSELEEWEIEEDDSWQALETAKEDKGNHGFDPSELQRMMAASLTDPTSRNVEVRPEQAAFERYVEEKSGRGGGELELEGGERGLRWLKEMCDMAAAKGEGAQFSGDELATAVYKVLESDRSGDEIAADLFDLIGDGGFELIQELLQHRKVLVEMGRTALSLLRGEKGGATLQTRAPRHGSQVSVQTESDKMLDKMKKREDKRMARARAGGGVTSAVDSELEWIKAAGGFDALISASENKKTSVVDSLIGTGDFLHGLKALPKGTIRKAFKGYEEVHVPAMAAAAQRPDERLVKISELDEFAQLPFVGYKTLNRIQSRIYTKAYHSNENILVCAPTGAGKTNIAMITVLHEIKQHFENGVLQRSGFKVVYVAPMKALAAEMTAAFSRRLAALGMVVKELTGDMQLSKRELEETQMIVTTPEKWDVITRKSSDTAFAALVKLLIIDEVHLLNDERGPVIETLVARTLRLVESSQSMIRIVGLSATLPNYMEVAQFLRVNTATGLFYFDSSYRPVPLAQQYIGVSEQNFAARNMLMHEICYDKVLEAVKRGKQAMVFVHARKDTVKTGRSLVEIAQRQSELGHFTTEDHPMAGMMKKEVAKSRNRELGELYESGFGIHHAGMLRSDRSLTEKLFSDGHIKVLVCTSTLAWGVNLPAHTVIIKGTQLYNPKAGGFTELGMLDVMQIFGRAGRPQFDTSGEGIIITTHSQLAHYLRLMTHQLPIESQFISRLKDNLNAEVVLGTVSNVREASAWLGYTYLFVRMQANPLAYGMTWEDVASDPGLVARRKALITDAARALDGAKMMRFDEKSGNMYVTELGRVASHFYIQYTSVETYNEMLRRHMSESEVFNLVSHSSEFENIVVREEELPELHTLRNKYCPLDIKGGIEDKFGKINLLMQVYLSRGFLEGFSLVADSSYITASLGRIMRALFEICLRRGWSSMAAILLQFCKAVDRRVWPHQHPLRQFDALLSMEILYKLEERNADMDRLYDMDEKEIGALIRHPHGGKLVHQCLQHFPRVGLAARISPITRTVLQVALTITPEFEWKDRFNGTVERWWIWVEDSDNEHIYHSEYFLLSKKMMPEGSHTISFTIPIFEPLPAQYYVRAISDTWLHAECLHTVSFKHLILPERHPPNTELLNLQPLPVAALKNPLYESLYSFSHFNPIQTQAFHTLYHTDHNVLLGAPTGSGKTISSELAILRLFSAHPGMKVIYIAPLKALVRERIKDWEKNLVPKLGVSMVELTGEFTPDLRSLLAADIIICTPEKWDGISRNWHSRTYAQKVGLMVIDEIHLLGADRGPILEVIVSRMRYIASQTESPIRFVGLSTALANARDLADWLGIEKVGLYNFKPSVRPVPLDVHIQGHPGRFYCPRMAAMNKPTYAAIVTHSPLKPVLIFVSSRRQTRLTALDLIQYSAADERPRQFVHVSEEDMEMLVEQVSSAELKHTLPFGIGLHHAGLNEKDRSLVEELFASRKIQILVCTSTLAWGVNLPAHLVVVKGTEFYDGRLKRYVDFPITDVLQMMGRAGRPQFDHEAKAVILVHEPKKSFYKKFLYEPFPVESSLPEHLADHLNAEVAGGTVGSLQDALDYLTWTFFFRRLLLNPAFYGLESTSTDSLNSYLSNMVASTLHALEDAGCLQLHEDGRVEPLMLGHVASLYYLHFTTLSLFSANLRSDTSLEMLLHIICGAAEYDELPVRHNEDKLNAQLAQEVRWAVDARTVDDPHTKANLLLQVHFSQGDLPISDYVTDTKSVLDQSVRILQACVDVAANSGWLQTTLRTMHLMQMVLQGLWWDTDSPLYMLPNMSERVEGALERAGIRSIAELLDCTIPRLRAILQPILPGSALGEMLQAVGLLPKVSVKCRAMESRKEGEEGGVVVEVQLSRRRLGRDQGMRAYLPRFPKIKEESWWLLVGEEASRELHALKRISLATHLTTRLLLPKGAVRSGQTVNLYLVSDCYLGLDQQLSVQIRPQETQKGNVHNSTSKERREDSHQVSASSLHKGLHSKSRIMGTSENKGTGNGDRRHNAAPHGLEDNQTRDDEDAFFDASEQGFGLQ